MSESLSSQRHLNNAGSSIMTNTTFDTVVRHMRREQEVGPYKAASEAKEEADCFYKNVASLLTTADPSEIAFMDSASRAWNMALYGCSLKRGDTIVTLASEFGTNLVTVFHRASQVDAKVEVIPCDIDGSFDLDLFLSHVAAGARLAAISHVAAHGSIVNPVEQIGRAVSAAGTIYLVDGCQAVGQIPVDVNAINCDAYTGTGRKWLRGPRGTGFLYVRKSAAIHAPQLDLAAADLELSPSWHVSRVAIRQDARQFELWERNFAGMLGLSSAMAQYLSKDRTKVNCEISRKADAIRQVVAENAALQLIGTTKSVSGIVGFVVKDPQRESGLEALLRKSDVQFGTMKDWDCPLHFPRSGVTSIFRISPHQQTTDAAVEHACAVLRTFT